MATRPQSALGDLSQVLWHERETLELVLFKLEEQRLLLMDGQDRWVCHASRELDAVLDQLGSMELNRALASAAAADELRVPEDAGLHDLAAAAPVPWPSVLERHVGALVRLAHEIMLMAAGNRALLNEGLTDVRKEMGARARRSSTRMLVDAAAYHAALATNERVLQPSLVDAVRGPVQPS
ncbi:MAG: flagellar export chaperone FlgN [Acidimicrobiales bacterium]